MKTTFNILCLTAFFACNVSVVGMEAVASQFICLSQRRVQRPLIIDGCKIGYEEFSVLSDPELKIILFLEGPGINLWDNSTYKFDARNKKLYVTTSGEKQTFDVAPSSKEGRFLVKPNK